MSAPRYKTRFSVTAHAWSPQPNETAYASIDRLRELLPAGIDPAAHPTILYVAGNLFVGGLMNLNDDAVTISDTLRVYRQFEGQPVNIEHSRGTNVGYIIKAGLSELGTDRLITEKEAREANKPFNVAIVVAIWRVADHDLVEYILEGALPGSPTKDDLSLSFEVGFDDYAVAILPKGVTNLAMATRVVTSQDPDYESVNKLLRINKGAGTYKGQHVGRILSGQIIPLGAGIVTTPAAAVKGLTPIMGPEYDTGDQDEDGASTDASLYKYSSTQVTLSAADAVPFVEFAKSIPDDWIYTDPDDPTLGRELSPHVTCLYGLKSADATPVQQILANVGPVSLTVGKMSVFADDKRPYEVLKLDVASEDLTRLHHLIKTSCDCDVKWPTYHPHLTLAYLKKGAAAPYIDDSRFEGRRLMFSSITFSPNEGPRVEIALKATFDTQPPVSVVYSTDESDPMASSRYIKLSAGWQDKIAAAQATVVDVTLSDGRKLLAVKVLDAGTLELVEEVSLAGVVISDLTPVVKTMTPGVGPQADDVEALHPDKANTYPTVTSEKQAQYDKNDAKQRAAQEAPYTSASAISESVASLTSVVETFARTGLSINTSDSSVSSTSQPLSTQPMDLKDLKQSLASVKTVEDLPTAVANVALFAEEIAKASEAHVKARQDAEQAAQQAQATLTEIKAKLDELTKRHDEVLVTQAAAAAEAAFQSRMATIEEVFAFDDDTRAELVDEVKACADDESFAKWLARAKKLFKHLTKDSLVAAQAAKTAAIHDEKEDDKEDDEECASAAKTAIASAKTDIVDAPVLNGVAAASTETLQERYRNAFANNVSIGGVRVADIKKHATA